MVDQVAAFEEDDQPVVREAAPRIGQELADVLAAEVTQADQGCDRQRAELVALPPRPADRDGALEDLLRLGALAEPVEAAARAARAERRVLRDYAPPVVAEAFLGELAEL